MKYYKHQDLLDLIYKTDGKNWWNRFYYEKEWRPIPSQFDIINYKLKKNNRTRSIYRITMRYYKVQSVYFNNIYYVYKVDELTNKVWHWSFNKWVDLSGNNKTFKFNSYNEITEKEAFLEIL